MAVPLSVLKFKLTHYCFFWTFSNRCKIMIAVEDSAIR
jgi:hypothetical protein